MLAKSQFTEAAIGMSLGYFLCDVVVIARNWAEVRRCSPSPSWFLILLSPMAAAQHSRSSCGSRQKRSVLAGLL